jgi:outer membrane protein TolC
VSWGAVCQGTAPEFGGRALVSPLSPMFRHLLPCRALPVLLGVLLAPSLPAQNAVVLPEALFPELADLLAEAATQSPRMLTRNLAAEIQAGSVQATRAGLLPQFGTHVSQTWGEEERTGGQTFDTDKLYYNISISQPLYHWGTLRNSLRIAKINEMIDAGRTEDAYQALAAEVRAHYLQLIIKTHTLETLRFRQRQAEQRLAQGRERVEARTIAPSEIFPLEIAADRADLAVLETEADLVRSQRALARLIGRPEGAPLPVPASIPALEPEAGVAVVHGLHQRFLGRGDYDVRAIEALRQQLEIHRLSLHNARMGLRPRFNLVLAMTQDEQTFGTFPVSKYESRYTYAGVSMSWTIFDSFRTKGSVRSALAQVRTTEQAVADAEADLATRLGTLADQLRFSARNLHINERLLQASAEGLKFQEGQFALGNISEEAVAGAREHLNVATLTALNTRYSHLMLLVQFLGAIDADPAVDRFFAQR